MFTYRQKQNGDVLKFLQEIMLQFACKFIKQTKGPDRKIAMTVINSSKTFPCVWKSHPQGNRNAEGRNPAPVFSANITVVFARRFLSVVGRVKNTPDWFVASASQELCNLDPVFSKTNQEWKLGDYQDLLLLDLGKLIVILKIINSYYMFGSDCHSDAEIAVVLEFHTCHNLTITYNYKSI